MRKAAAVCTVAAFSIGGRWDQNTPKIFNRMINPSGTPASQRRMTFMVNPF